MDNDGIDHMDEMETRLAMIGLGEMGYFILLGAIGAGAEPSEAMRVVAAFFASSTMAGQSVSEDESEEDNDNTE